MATVAVAVLGSFAAASAADAHDRAETSTTTPTGTRSDSGDDGYGLGVLATVGVIGLALGLVAGRLFSGGRKPAPVSGGFAMASQQPEPDAATVVPPTAPAPDSRVGEQRTALASALIELRDRFGDDALTDEILDRLRRVGIDEIIVAQGELFDPARHQGVGEQSVTDQAWDQRVATTERPGYRDGDRVLRAPRVIVYRYDSSSPASQ